MNRILVFDSGDNYLFDIDPNRVLSAFVTEEINASHYLDISTSQVLAQGNRLLTLNDMGTWEEYVVVNDSSQHDKGSTNAYGTYHAMWSLQYDLMTVYGDDVESGGQYDVAASVALANALNGTQRWGVGTVTASGYATIEMFGNSAYERIQSIIKAYGGEVQPAITVGVNKVTSRNVDILAVIGKQVPTRRFEWKRDVTQIKRKAQEAPLCCRIIPIGKSDDVTIEDVNNGVRYIEDSEAAAAYRMPDGHGGYEYPTRKVKFSEIDDDRELLAHAREHIQEYTRPVPTYEASVTQYEAAGMGSKGVALGDVIQIVDYGFNPSVPLRLEGRARKVVRSLVNDRDVVLTIGDVSESLALSFQQIDSAMMAVKSRMDKVFGGSLTSTAAYLEWLTGKMNQFVNALGGYAYIIPGRGIVTYSVEVSDPEVGAEAKAAVASGNGYVTEIRGGAVRIANSLTSGGDWDFTTVLLPGQIASNMITAAQLVSGFIGSPSGNYWNLDTGELTMQSNIVRVGNQTLANYVSGAADDAFDAVTQMQILSKLTGGYTTEGLYIQNGHLYINGSAIKTGVLDASLITAGKIQSANGKVYFDLDNNEIAANKLISTVTGAKSILTVDSNNVGDTSSMYGLRLLNSDNTTNYLAIVPATGTGTGASGATRVYAKERLELYSGDSPFATGTLTGASIGISKSGRISMTARVSDSHLDATTSGYVTVMGNFSVNGTKSRLTRTDNYNDRLLYAYETASPMFGDVGSARTGSDGLCYVSIDDIFSETADTGIQYQVFIQPCGEGSLYVKHKDFTYFVVCGTPELDFDWEIKARQKGYENTRLGDYNLLESINDFRAENSALSFDVYGADSDYASLIESLYE